MGEKNATQETGNTIQATGTFITKKGLALITKLAVAKGELCFTRAAVGTGKPPEGYSPEGMVNLNQYCIDADISDYGMNGDKAYVTIQVNSGQVDKGFLLTEVGVFAFDPDEGEILYAYMDLSNDPTYIYANGSSYRLKFAEFTLYLLVGSVERVTAAVVPQSIITRETLTAANMKVKDVSGLVGPVGANVTGQEIMDVLAHKVATELVTNSALTEILAGYILKDKIVNNYLATDVETALSGVMGKELKERIETVNTKLPYINTNNKLHTFVINEVYTATQDCIVAGFLNFKNGTGAVVVIDNNVIGFIGANMASGNIITPIWYPIRAGSTIQFQKFSQAVNDFIEFNINAFGLKA